jgi:hypothetical protein
VLGPWRRPWPGEALVSATVPAARRPQGRGDASRGDQLPAGGPRAGGHGAAEHHPRPRPPTARSWRAAVPVGTLILELTDRGFEPMVPVIAATVVAGAHQLDSPSFYSGLPPSATPLAPEAEAA